MIIIMRGEGSWIHAKYFIVVVVPANVCLIFLSSSLPLCIQIHCTALRGFPNLMPVRKELPGNIRSLSRRTLSPWPMPFVSCCCCSTSAIPVWLFRKPEMLVLSFAWTVEWGIGVGSNSSRNLRMGLEYSSRLQMGRQRMAVRMTSVTGQDLTCSRATVMRRWRNRAGCINASM